MFTPGNFFGRIEICKPSIYYHMVSFLFLSEEREGTPAFFYFSKTLFALSNCVLHGQEHCRSEQEGGNICILVMAVDKHFQDFQYIPCSSKIPMVQILIPSIV